MITRRYVASRMPRMFSSVVPKRGLPSASVVPKLSRTTRTRAETKNVDIQSVPGSSSQVHSRSGLPRVAVGRHQPTLISV